MGFEIRSIRECGDGGWRVYLSSRAGSGASIRRRFQAPSRDDAERRAWEILDEMNRSWTVADALGAYLRDGVKGVADQTLRDYRTLARLCDPVADRFLDDLPKAEVQAFLDHLSCDYSGHTVKKVNNILSAAYRHAVGLGKAKENPCVDIGVSLPEPKKIASDGLDRLKLLLPYMRGDLGCAIGLVVECRLSVGEVCALADDDVRDGAVHVGKKAMRSRGGERIVVAYGEWRICEPPEWLANALRDMSGDRRGFLFGDEDAPADPSSLSKRARPVLRMLGIGSSLSQLGRMEGRHPGQ